jgi:hypothetical protein
MDWRSPATFWLRFCAFLLLYYRGSGSPQKEGPMSLTPEQIQAMRLVMDAVVESVQVAGDRGAPGGVIYAAMMAHGITLAQYNAVMGGLVRANRLRRQGELYFVVAPS